MVWLKCRWEWVLAPALIAALSLPGFVHVNADQGLHWTDLGYWSIDARNSVLWGRAFWDSYNLALLAPLQYALAKVAFLIAGPSWAVARVLGGIKVAALLVATYCVARRAYGRAPAVLAVLLLGSSPFIIQMGRQALVEPLSAVLVLLAVLSYFRGPHPTRSGFVSGLLAGGSVCAKLSGVTAVVPFLLLLGYDVVKSEQRTRALASGAGALLAGGMGVAFALWHWPETSLMLSVEAARGTGQGYLSNLSGIFVRPEHPAASATVLWGVFTAAAMAIATTDPVRAWRHLKHNRLTSFLLFWLVAKTLLNPLVSRMQSARRWEDLFPVVAVLAALMLTRILSKTTSAKPSSVYAPILGPVVVALAMLPLWGRTSQVLGLPPVVLGCTALVAAWPVSRWLSRQSTQDVFAVGALLVGAVCMLLHLDRPNNVGVTGSLALFAFSGFLFLSNRTMGVARSARMALGGIAVVALMVPLFPFYSGRGFTYGAHDFARRCAQRIGEKEYVIGEGAYTFCLENRGIPVQFYFDKPDRLNANRAPFETYHPRWAIVCPDAGPKEHVFASEPVDSWDSNVFLYRLNDADYVAAMKYHMQFQDMDGPR